jgi:AraC-like DNA-binding protein
MIIEHTFHYLPVSDLMMKWGFYLTGGGRGSTRAGAAYPPSLHPLLYHFNWSLGRTLPEFQMLLITDGRGLFESELTGAVAVESDSILLLFPGVWHRYRPDPVTGWTERWISFHGDIGHRLMDLEIISPKKPVWPIRETQRFARSFDRLLDLLEANVSRNPIELSFRALSLFADASELLKGEFLAVEHKARKQSGRIEDPLVAGALELIWTHSHQILSVSQLARHFSVTRRTLDRRFRAALHRTALDEINGCRIARAKRLLQETNLPLKTIARLAGFTNAERMRLVFCETEKMTPTAFRTKARSLLPAKSQAE